jgi:hypothetical protein
MATWSHNQVAEELGISNGMLDRLIALGIVSPTARLRKPANEWRQFSESDLAVAERALRELRWLAVVTPDSWSRLTADGLTYTLLSARYARIAETLRAGNSVVFYVTGFSTFCGIAQITGPTQRRRTLWPQGVFPYWVPLSPQIVRRPEDGVKAKVLLSKLDFIAKKKSWEQYFRTTVRLLTEDDFQVIEKAVSEATSSPIALPVATSHSR